MWSRNPSVSIACQVLPPSDTTCPYPCWPKPSHTYVSFLASLPRNPLSSPTDLESVFLDGGNTNHLPHPTSHHLDSLLHPYSLRAPEVSGERQGTFYSAGARAAKSSPKENPKFQVSSEKGVLRRTDTGSHRHWHLECDLKTYLGDGKRVSRERAPPLFQ